MSKLQSWFPKVEKLKPLMLEISKKEKTPLYIYDKKEAQESLRNFKNAFKKQGITADIYYATKSNYYLGLLKTVVGEGEGIDVSSQRELSLALQAGCKKMVYTGPAKTEEDFELILKHHNKIIVNLDNYRELYLLQKMAAKKGITMRCGIRICTRQHKGWNKFGISLKDLRNFYEEAKKCKNIDLQGLHFNMSWNSNAKKFVKALKEIGIYLKNNFKKDERNFMKFIDIGGGCFSEYFRGDYPWNKKEVMYIKQEKIIKNIMLDKYQPRYKEIKVDHIDKIAEDICNVWKTYILPVMGDIKLITEPGRFISANCIHFLFKMIDPKANNFGIVDGCGNMVGWELYQYFWYVPIFNLSQFTLENEFPYITYGSLCTPEDIWGFYLYSKNLPKEGDIFFMPFQGDYTFSLAQTWIREIPKVIEI